MWLCGSGVPNNFRRTSKFRKLQVRFKSNGSVTRPGFRAVVEATGASRSGLVGDRLPEDSPIVFTKEISTNGTQAET